MRLTQIQFGRCANMLAIPIAVGVEEDEDATAYIFYFLFFYIGITFKDVEI
jgi:hypothetical protein